MLMGVEGPKAEGDGGVGALRSQGVQGSRRCSSVSKGVQVREVQGGMGTREGNLNTLEHPRDP